MFLRPNLYNSLFKFDLQEESPQQAPTINAAMLNKTSFVEYQETTPAIPFEFIQNRQDSTESELSTTYSHSQSEAYQKLM